VGSFSLFPDKPPSLPFGTPRLVENTFSPLLFEKIFPCPVSDSLCSPYPFPDLPFTITSQTFFSPLFLIPFTSACPLSPSVSGKHTILPWLGIVRFHLSRGRALSSPLEFPPFAPGSLSPFFGKVGFVLFSHPFADFSSFPSPTRDQFFPFHIGRIVFEIPFLPTSIVVLAFFPAFPNPTAFLVCLLFFPPISSGNTAILSNDRAWFPDNAGHHRSFFFPSPSPLFSFLG